MPAVDRTEMMSMLEFQLEKLSPLPVAQSVWNAEMIPSAAEKMQTAIVCIVSRDAVEDFLGGAEEVGDAADCAEGVLSQVEAEGEFSGEAVVAEFGDLAGLDGKTLGGNEIAQGLGIPRKEVVIGFVWVEMAIFCFFFVGNKYK